MRHQSNQAQYHSSPSRHTLHTTCTVVTHACKMPRCMPSSSSRWESATEPNEAMIHVQQRNVPESQKCHGHHKLTRWPLNMVCSEYMRQNSRMLATNFTVILLQPISFQAAPTYAAFNLDTCYGLILFFF